MNNKNSEKENGLKTEKSPTSKYGVFVLRLILPITIIIIGSLCLLYLLKTSPKSKRQPPIRQARLVEYTSIEPANIPIKVNAMGTVIAAQEIDLQSQVSGKIIKLSPELVRGGTFQKNQMLVEIEPNDYELLVNKEKVMLKLPKVT